MTIRSTALILVVLTTLGVADIWFRLHTPSIQYEGTSSETPLADQESSLSTLTPLPSPFDLFYGDVPSHLTEQKVSDIENSEAVTTSSKTQENYKLLGIRRDADKTLRAIVALSGEPAKDRTILTLQENDTIGQARVLAIESHSILLESPTRGQLRLRLFKPAGPAD